MQATSAYFWAYFTGRLAAKAAVERPLTRQFDWPPERSRFSLDWRLWGGVSVRDAAGRAGSFEGTPPRHFFACGMELPIAGSQEQLGFSSLEN